jgi:predicted ATPase/class 3 adenylate cyclase
VNCPICQATNRDGASFCKSCGHVLLAHCPRCRAALPAAPDPDFCDNCGLALTARAQFAWLDGAGAARVAEPRSSAPPHPPAAASAAVARGPLAAGAQLAQYVPQELLNKLKSARASGEMVGERRVVTMLFCDVQGSTAAAEQLDPEDWTEVINGAFARMIQPVYQYEGTVARLMGDAILAFFGAPLAHEDDPQRAVLAGLGIVAGIQPYQAEMKQKWGIDFGARVGINTGLVVVGAVGSDLRVEYSALGDAINIAARMEQTAQPGTVQIAHDTYKLVKPLFEIEELGRLELKGKAEPIPTYRVLRPKAEPSRRRGIEGLQAAIVGRDQELSAVRAILMDLGQGVGHIICLTAEAGLGKSRLIEETHRLFRETSGPKGKWILANSLSYETDHAYALLRDLTSRLAGAEAEDPAQASADPVAKLLAGSEVEGEPAAQQVLEILLGVDGGPHLAPLEGEAFKRLLLRVVQAVWRQRLKDAPAVLVCDDMHWGDSASTTVLEHLLPLIEEIPLVIMLAMRPDRESPAWRLKTAAVDGYHHRFTEITLPPLSEAQTDELVNRLLTIADLPEALRARIRERTGGNPFFVEEVIRSLIETGAVVREERADLAGTRLYWRATSTGAVLDIPDSLQSLLTARIDRLEEHARRTVQLASVVGRSFYYKVLAALEAGDLRAGAELDRNLKALMRAEMIQEAARIPEVEYRFRNPLTQEIAYHTILLKRRRELHRLVAEAIEALFPDRLAEQAPRLSFHFSEAQEPARALKYLILAADSAYCLFANTEAIRGYSEALKLAQPGQATVEQIEHLYLRRGRALELEGQFEAALANYRELEAAGLERGDRHLELAAVAAQGTIYSTPSDAFNGEKSEALAQRGLALARELGDGAAEAKILWNMLLLYRFTKEPREALEVGEQSLALARQLGLREQLAFTLHDLYYSYLRSGQLSEALAASLEARQLWRDLGNRAMLADNLSVTILMSLLTGQREAAISDSQEAFAISRSIENAWGMSFSQMMLGMAYWPLGQFDQGIAVSKSCMQHAEKSGFLTAQNWSSGELGLMYGLLGQYERGLAMIRLALDETLAKHQMPWQLLAYLALVYLAMGSPDRAQEIIKTRLVDELADPILKAFLTWGWNSVLIAQGEYALAVQSAGDFVPVLRRFGFKLFVPDTLLALGQAQLGLGQIDLARAALTEAQAEAEEMGLDWILWQILAARAQLETQAGRAAASGECLSQARQIVKRIADGLSDLELKASFLDRQVVRALMAEPAAGK